jgi:hypothetical protein
MLVMKTGILTDVHYPFRKRGLSTYTDEGDQLMEIKSLAELEKRAMAEISIGIYGEELTRIMLPELKDYFYGSIEKDEIA